MVKQIGGAKLQRASSATLEAMEVRRLLAAELVSDINLDTADAAPAQFVEFGGGVLFDASDGVNGRQLWRTDGTAGGTELVKKISESPEILLMPPLSGVAMFFAADPVHGKELWRTDGTAEGTYLLKDINPGTASSPRPPVVTHVPPPDKAVVINDVLYFQASDGVHGLELWRSDGTADGTDMVRDINPGSAGSGIAHQVAVGNTLYFAAGDNTSTWTHLWRSDGTAAGTARVDPSGSAGIAPRDLTAVGDEVGFFTPRSGGVWELRRSDGTAAGTRLLASFSARPAWLTAVGDALYFVASDAETGVELWHSDAAGTARVKDINPAGNSAPTQVTAFNGEAYFVATDGVSGRELWKSNGTEGGTTQVKDLNLGAGSSLGTQANFTVFNGALYFAGDDGAAGPELWRSDGTEPGTTRVSEIVPGVDGAAINNLRAVGGALYFSGNDLLHGRELWRSDGTSGGTGMVKDLNPLRSLSSSPGSLVRAGDQVYFLATRARTGAELWRSDGTTAGTHLVKDIRPGSAGQKSSDMLYLGATLYFTADDGIHGTELWKSDGTEGGTVLLKDVFPGTNSGTVGRFAAVGDTVYFFGGNAPNDYELWKTDGTEAGTVRVKDITPGTGTAFIYDMIEYQGQLYFGYGWGTQELWRSDGTEAGTVKVKEVGGPVGVDNFAVVDGTLFFTGNGSGAGVELWKTDGTAAGTTLVKDINTAGDAKPRDLTAFNGRLYFWATTAAHGEELWTSDGTDAGTYLVKDVYPGSASPFASKMTVGGNYLYFAATDPTYGNELWLTDGTSTGTRMVKEIVPGTSLGAIVSPAQMAYANGLLYFAAGGYTPQGQEVWQTDGTEAGTILSADVVPGDGSSMPRNLITVGDSVFFSATDQRGTELWKLPAPPPAWLSASAGAAYTFDGTTLTVTAGTVTVNDDIGLNNAGAGVVVRSGATVIFNAAQHLASLTLSGGAATLAAGGNKFLRTRSLNITDGGRLDLSDNDVLIDYSGSSPLGSFTGSAYTGIAGMIQAGRTVNGTWDGPGIITSMPDAASGLTGIGVGEAANLLGLSAGETAVWNGHTVDSTSVLIKYTYAGDANVDGRIDAGDYGRIDNFVQIPGASGYSNGDFNYDGFIDAGDYGIIDNNIQAQGSPLGSSMTAAAVEESTAAMQTSPSDAGSSAVPIARRPLTLPSGGKRGLILLKGEEEERLVNSIV